MARERKYEAPTSDEIDYAADVAGVDENGHRPLHIHFGEWIAEKTGATSRFKTQKEVQAFIDGATFALRYRSHHQRSPENAAFKEEARSANEQDTEARAEARAAKQAAKATASAAEKPAPRARAAKVVPVAEPAAKPVRGKRAASAEPEVAAPARKVGRPVRTVASARPAAATRPGRPARAKAGAEPDF